MRQVAWFQFCQFKSSLIVEDIAWRQIARQVMSLGRLAIKHKEDSTL